MAADPNELLRAYALATRAGDKEAAAALHEQILAAYQAQTRAEADPSAGGGTLHVGPIDTHVPLPQGAERLLAGAGQGMTDIVRKLGNLAGGVGGTSDAALEEAERRDAPLLATGAGRAGALIGQAAATAPLGLGAAGAVGEAGALGARIAANPLARAAVEGAAQGAVSAKPGERTLGLVTGAGMGALLPGLYKAYRVARAGVSPTKAAQLLMRKGVDLSPGQMNPSGLMNTLEESFEKVPGVGSTRQRAQQQFQQAVLAEGAAPGAAAPAATGDINQMLDRVYQGFDAAYDAGKGFPVGAKIMSADSKDTPLSQAFAQLTSRARAGLTPDVRKEVNNDLQTTLNEIVQAARKGGGMKSDDLLALRSMIRQRERSVGADTAEGRAMRDLLGDAEQKVTDALESQLPADAMSAVRATDAQYAKYKVIEDAVRRGGDQPQGFTPAQLSSAVRAATDKGAYARGAGPLRQLASAGRDVFTARSPMTGFRVAPVLAAGGATAAAPHVTLPLLASALGLVATPLGRRIAAGQSGAQLAARALERQARRAVPKDARAALADELRALAVAAGT